MSDSFKEKLINEIKKFYRLQSFTNSLNVKNKNLKDESYKNEFETKIQQILYSDFT